jgi:putative ABC transport system permease protein
MARILWVSAVGIAVGVGCAWLAAPTLAAILYEVDPRDPMAFLWAAGIAFAVAVVACFWPALRAARMLPALALHDS